MIHRSIRRVGNRNNKRIDGLIALGVVIRRANRHPSAEVDLKGMAELRWKKSESMRKMCEARLRGQWTTRALPKEGKVLASEVRKAYESDRKRAELALQLDLALERFCARRADVEGRNSVLSLLAYQTLESHYVARVPPMEDMVKLVEALKTDTPCAEAEFFFKHGGTGLWRAWQALTGQGRSYPPKKQTVDWRLEQIGNAATWEPQTEKAPAIASLQTIANSEGEPGAIARKASLRRWRTFKTLKLAALVATVSLALSAATYVYIDPGLRAYRVYLRDGMDEAISILEAELNSKEASDYAYYLLGHGYYLKGEYDKAKKVAFELLLNAKTDNTRGDCYYLLGHISKDLGHPERAISHFQEAQVFFKNSPLRLYSSKISEAWASTPDSAMRILNELAPMIEKDGFEGNKLHFLRIKTRVSIQMKNYGDALNSAFQARKLCSTKNDIGRIYSNIGYIYAATGNLAEGTRYTDEAEGIFRKEKDERLLIYNDLNKIVIRKCQGASFAIQKRIANYAKKTGDSTLQADLEKALNEGCLLNGA